LGYINETGNGTMKSFFVVDNKRLAMMYPKIEKEWMLQKKFWEPDLLTLTIYFLANK
jgi:hypothetical protein